MSNANQLVESYLAAWNERDAKRRHELISKTWTEDGTYVDPHRSGNGYAELSKMMAAVHERFSTDYRFRLLSDVDAYGDRVRFQWEVGGTKEAPQHFVGTDFALISSDGRFKSVTGFVDEAPGMPTK
jgi:SnoaL-like domain